MRESGWYWVKRSKTSIWVPVYWALERRSWFLLIQGGRQDFGKVTIVGPRIPEPPAGKEGKDE